MVKKTKSKPKHELIIFKNPDKECYEKQDESNLGNLPHPFRLILASVPSSGKTSVILNLIIHNQKPFEKIMILHYDKETKEYDHVDHEMLSEMPSVEDIDRTKKNLLIIEDVDLKSLDKASMSRCDRLFGYVSSHMNLSVICTAQRPYNIPKALRDTANFLLMWRTSDIEFIKRMGEQYGLDKKHVVSLFEIYCKTRYDFLVFSKEETPKIRRNLFEPIE